MEAWLEINSFGDIDLGLYSNLRHQLQHFVSPLRTSFLSLLPDNSTLVYVIALSISGFSLCCCDETPWWLVFGQSERYWDTYRACVENYEPLLKRDCNSVRVAMFCVLADILQEWRDGVEKVPRSHFVIWHGLVQNGLAVWRSQLILSDESVVVFPLSNSC